MAEEKLKKLQGFKQITKDEEKMKVIKATYSPREWKMDPKGYFLIRIDRKTKEIEVGFCKNDEHKIIKKIIGKNPIEIFYTIIREGLISKLEHAADIGSELQKAYIALQQNLEYIQDKDLDFTKKHQQKQQEPSSNTN